MDLVRQLRAGEASCLLFGITPPKAATGADELERITSATLDRLRTVELDGLALYDIADEQDRNPEQRPFPFLPTLDPDDYRTQHLTGFTGPTVVYRVVGKYSEDELTRWMRDQPSDRVAAVLVGASSRDNVGATTLRRAYELRREVRPDLLAGAVVIPERHRSRGDEHLRMLGKQDAGVSFFVTQIVYDVNAAKDLLADYADTCEEREIEPRPVVFTHAVCGSAKTLDFLAWLGVGVPRWIERDLRRSESTLDASCEQARVIAADLVSYGRRIGVPVGLNVESVSSRKVEIEAAVRLAGEFRRLL